ncbi:MAG: ATP-dependent zinc metalloprotease FtsH [Parcubacteria group bacterium GW2011_GWA2_42_35]|nr:MAG: ATP-dependent zinc metalloprotease FtsH [Parcubacteria group bacterium GW2011_GWC2_42_13]KKS58171.1 MAG: ATP-dependent zinc metalloprotease FtsH [Parcubacteria group bacterium GW2011_GWA2_42_35]
MKNLSKNLFVGLLIFMILAGAYSFFAGKVKKTEEISLSRLVEEIKQGTVKKITVKGEALEIELKSGAFQSSKKESESAISQTFANYGLSSEIMAGIVLEVKEQSGALFWLGAVLPFLLPVLFIFFFFWLASRQVKSSQFQAFSFGQSRAKVVSPEDSKNRVLFKNVAGVEEAKEELKEIVDFLKNPKKFLDIGAKIPKGVLMMGPPGSGKTLLARAVAGEAGVPFFHISGSEFVEMFVGVGASRVRSLFKEAKKAAPSIIFIDEIDAVGRHRGAGLGGGHDEREQTLNQILVEMDGFEPHDQVVLMAATNRPDVLDPALLRPGRFDRRVVLDLPDLKAREEILKIHSQKKPLVKDIDLRQVAERTPGFSGADLENLMNEGAILAARQERKEITQSDLLISIEKVLLGPERKSHLLTQEEKKISAYHEAGHALVAAVLPGTDPIHKVSIVSRGRAAGYTLKLPIEDRHLYSKSHFLKELAVSLGGYASEQLIFEDITTGAADDLRRATDVARALATKYGMSEKLGPITFGDTEELIFLGKEIATEKNYSESVATLIDQEVSKFMKNAFKTAKQILTQHRNILEAIAGRLMEKETIEKEEFQKLVVSFGLKYQTHA